jgi:hypothetical protein
MYIEGATWPLALEMSLRIPKRSSFIIIEEILAE